MLARQVVLNGGLLVMQQVQHPVQIVDAALPRAPHTPQRERGRVVVPHAVRDPLRRRLYEA